MQLVTRVLLTDRPALYLCAAEHASHGQERTTPLAFVPALYLKEARDINMPMTRLVFMHTGFTETMILSR